MNPTTHAGRIAAAIAAGTAILVAAPVISIIALAMQPAPDVWQHLIDYVLPPTLLDTALLLGGVGALSLAIGTGTAWAISLHEFRGRALLLWLVPLPLAIPTYLAAYVYVDLFEPLGLVHRTLAIWFPLQDAVRVLPNLRSLPGAIIVIALVLYPYVYLSARTMFQFQSAEFAEAAKTLGASRWTDVLADLAADGAAGAGGRRRAGIAGNAERYRRQRISRRPHPDGVGVHDLAQSRQPCRRRAAVLLHAGDRGRPDRDRALRPPQCHDGVFRRKPAADAANARSPA